MPTVLGVFKVAEISFFLQKPLTKDTAQMALILVFNGSPTAKKSFVHLSEADSQRKFRGLRINYGSKGIFNCSRVPPKPSKSVLEH